MNAPATLKNIAPFWYDKITMAQDMIDIRISTPDSHNIHDELNIHTHGCCLVSEAYGFTSDYLAEDDVKESKTPCSTCTSFSYQLDATAYRSDPEAFEMAVATFTKHYQEMHAQTPGA